MSERFRQCTATVKNGDPCRAFAVHNLDPPLCAAHAGLNVGAGAPLGNKNALTHGLYSKQLSAAEEAMLVMYANQRSLLSELVIARVELARLMRYQAQEEVTAERKAAMATMIFRGIRTIAFLNREIGQQESDFDWNAITYRLLPTAHPLLPTLDWNS